MNPKTGAALPSTPLIGEGAGMAKTYLDASGRTRQLRKAGKEIILFENIEVVSNIWQLLGAHLRAQTERSTETTFVVVREQQGYSGGKPALVVKANGDRNAGAVRDLGPPRRGDPEGRRGVSVFQHQHHLPTAERGAAADAGQ